MLFLLATTCRVTLLSYALQLTCKNLVPDNGRWIRNYVMIRITTWKIGVYTPSGRDLIVSVCWINFPVSNGTVLLNVLSMFIMLLCYCFTIWLDETSICNMFQNYNNIILKCSIKINVLDTKLKHSMFVANFRLVSNGFTILITTWTLRSRSVLAKRVTFPIGLAIMNARENFGIRCS